MSLSRISTHSFSDSPLSEAFISFARVTALSLPLSGCAAPLVSEEKDTTTNCVLSADAPLQLYTILAPPPGMALSEINFRDGVAQPALRPASEIDTPFSNFELSLIKNLLSEHNDQRAAALETPGIENLARMQPLLLHLALNDLDTPIADQAARILAHQPTAETILNVCEMVAKVSGSDLTRCLQILKSHPTPTVAQALLKSIRTSGYLEKEGRDELMQSGKVLVQLGDVGRPAIKSLLKDPDPRMRMAAAVSLASQKDSTALTELLNQARYGEHGIRAEALSYLPEFAERDEILEPLYTALQETELAYTALIALREVGAAALPILAPYSRVNYFEAIGIERKGPNPYLPGVSYGEIVEAIIWCSLITTDDLVPDSPIAESAIDAILNEGIKKLTSDLDHPQLRPGATQAILSLGPRAYDLIPELLPRNSARPLLLQFPTSALLDGCGEILSDSTVSQQSLESCHLLAERIRLNNSNQIRECDLQEVLESYPEAPWLRYLLGQVWRESIDSEWVRSAICRIEDSRVLTEILAELEAADSFSIDLPLRWSPSNLKEILRNRSRREIDGRPIAALVYPEADYNGAFTLHNSVIETLINSGYRVMVYDEAGRQGVIQALHNSANIAGAETPADLIFLAAHSERTEMTFGSGTNSDSKVSVSDLELLLKHNTGKSLKPDGQVILIACSAGAGRESAENIANMWRKVFIQAKEDGIWSSEVPDNIRGIELSESGKLLNVLFFKGPIYRP